MKPITIDDIQDLYWFDKYKANMEKNRVSLARYISGRNEYDINGLLRCSFVFASTHEGQEYWLDICKENIGRDSLAKIIDDL
jgi:hypothetical protein